MYTIVMIPKLDPESETNCDTSETKRVHLSGLEPALLSVNLRASHQNVMFQKQVSSDVMRRWATIDHDTLSIAFFDRIRPGMKFWNIFI